MRKGGYIPLPQDPSLFVKICSRGICFVGINTDDGIVFGTSQAMVDEFHSYYNGLYDVKWGPVTRFGGVNGSATDG